MAYQENTIATLDDIPALVRTFAASIGWNVVGGVIRHPNYNGGGPGGMAFEILTQSSGLNHDLIMRNTVDTTKGARLRCPIWADASAPTVGIKKTPTKLFLIGMMTPQPYLAIVVEFGYNLYRHMYLGYMEKQGSYDGGAILSACTGVEQPFNGNAFFRNSNRMRYLFQGHQMFQTGSDSGGVQVIAADNPTEWRKFRDLATVSGNGSSDVWNVFNDNTVAYGGYGDDLNDALVAKGKAPVAGGNILVPIDIAIVRFITTDFRLKPVGIPSGVRMINNQELDPQAQIEVGGENWYVFAAISKQATQSNTRAGTGGSAYRGLETSYYLGYAYRG